MWLRLPPTKTGRWWGVHPESRFPIYMKDGAARTFKILTTSKCKFMNMFFTSTKSTRRFFINIYL